MQSIILNFICDDPITKLNIARLSEVAYCKKTNAI